MAAGSLSVAALALRPEGMITTDTIEQIAAEELRLASLGGAVDIHALAKRKKIVVRLGPPGMRSCLLGRTIVVPSSDPPKRRRFGTAHELAHLFYRERELEPSEQECDALASALLHPRGWFLERMRERGPDLRGLAEDCVHSSHEAIMRRLLGFDHAALWICDRGPWGKLSRRYCSSGTTPPIARRATRAEREIVRTAASSMRDQHVDGVSAWPIEADGTLRVIALSRVEDLVRLSD
jgi:Zn-dependent peptidase ImmA (M78 family)